MVETVSGTTDGEGDGEVDGEAGEVSSSGEPTPLPCDDGFAFEPDPPVTGAVSHVLFTADEPLTYVDLRASGDGDAIVTFDDLVASDPWTWRWAVVGLTPSVWTFTFSHGETPVDLGSCQRMVQDTGEPPAPSGDCDPGHVCGDVDEGGQLCEFCPMVDTCLDPPAPFGPGGPGEWDCLDDANCLEDDRLCRIWCPGEPCDMTLHPDGCPQGVETCFVDATISSYEEACQTCCESRYHEPTGEYACWDSALNLCRYPGDCGLPLP